jgi:hypothetical protein
LAQEAALPSSQKRTAHRRSVLIVSLDCLLLIAFSSPLAANPEL